MIEVESIVSGDFQVVARAWENGEDISPIPAVACISSLAIPNIHHGRAASAFRHAQHAMIFGDNVEKFAGKQVQDYQPGGSLGDPQQVIPRIRWDWDGEQELVEILASLLQDPKAEELTGLVIGAFGEDMYETPPTDVMETLIQAADRLPNLTALFVGDMTYEENEVSWIYHTDMSPVWEAFPQLTHVGIRGSNDLKLGKMELPELEYLLIQSGGLPSAVIKEILNAKLPSLKHLELYLGDSGYGWDGDVDTVRPFLENDPFPQLEYLGLKNSEIADEICQVVSGAAVLDHLKVLDFSLGTLSDVGGRALLEAKGLDKLTKLDLHRHYLSGEVVSQLEQLPCTVDLTEAEGPSEEDRYVVHAE